jgi:enoyl-CoA hydratase/carnithine racemase
MGMNGVAVERLDGGIVRVTLDRASSRNALDDELAGALIDTMSSLGEDDATRCVVLTGAGDAFCSGGNVKDMLAGTGMFGGSAAQMRRAYRTGIQRVPLVMHALEVPVVAAVNGVAIGAGLDLALMCDVRIASDRATFAESFVRLGLVSGDGGAWLLQRAVGPARAAQMTLTAATIDAATAATWGLVSEVVPGDALEARAMAIAAQIASHPPHSVRLNKRLLRDSARLGLHESLELAASLQSIAQHTEDHREALRAFAEKRKPQFHGR